MGLPVRPMVSNIFTLSGSLPGAGRGTGSTSPGERLGGPPVAAARLLGAPPANAPSANKVAELLQAYKGKSVGQGYLGPGWVDESGLAWLIVVSASVAWPRAARQSKTVAFITWRWNNSPSAPVSLTAVVPNQRLAGPSPRWFTASDDPVMTAIRATSRFMVLLAHPDGVQSGWFLAEYPMLNKQGEPVLERQFTNMPTPGIRGSRTGQRYDPANPSEGERENEIPLWSEPRSDFWAALHYSGPWSGDLQHVDRLQTRWGVQLLRSRGQAAGSIELLRDRFLLDGEQPFFNADGTPTSRLGGSAFEALSKAATDYPEWAKLAAAVAGPIPDAETAFKAAIACISEPHNCWGLVSVGFDVLPEIEDEHLMPAIKMFTECALLSPEVTQEGLAKPWLANSFEGLVLKSTPLELSVAVEDVEAYWRQGLELHEVIDSGLWARGVDLPYPLGELAKRMAGTTIDGGIEAAEARTLALLAEAIEARQWSIPWGAHIDLSVGPFTSLRIYEVQGEFTCLFVDDRNRYYHVAIGLRQQRPQFLSSRFLKHSDVEKDGPKEPATFEWDDESQMTLQLIAAAVVRDFLVVEDRDAVFTGRTVVRRVKGHEVKTVIYLPRVTYHRLRPASEQTALDRDAPVPRPRHAVTQHLRKVGTASAAQRFLAQRYGVYVPEGFTFVRPHERGATANVERVRVYRSRSASRMLFEVVEAAPAGSRPAWFEFEKDCAQLLRGRGLSVQHQAVHRDGDGGVDLYATDKDGQGYVAQCKCWGLHRPVGPEVVRELHGAIARADVGAAAPSKGILITTSRFTAGALELASTFGYECLDGERFAAVALSEGGVGPDYRRL